MKKIFAWVEVAASVVLAVSAIVGYIRVQFDSTVELVRKLSITAADYKLVVTNGKNSFEAAWKTVPHWREALAEGHRERTILDAPLHHLQRKTRGGLVTIPVAERQIDVDHSRSRQAAQKALLFDQRDLRSAPCRRDRCSYSGDTAARNDHIVRFFRHFESLKFKRFFP